MIFGLISELVDIVIDAVVECWNEIVNWVSALFAKLKRVWRQVVFKAKKVIAERLVKFIEKYYYQQKNSNKWMEQTTTREIPEDEVPPHIRNNVGRRETDITEEMNEELELVY